MAEAGRHLWSIPLLKKGQLKPAAQDCVQMDFECLQGQRLHNLSGQPVPMLSHPLSNNIFFLCSDEISCSSLCPLPPVLSLGSMEKSLAPSSHSLPSGIYTHLQDSPESGQGHLCPTLYRF